MVIKKLGTARYRGGRDLFAVDAWLQNLEQNFRATHYLEDFKKDMIVYYLEKDAMSWWLCVNRYFGGVTVSWSDFRQAFRRKYFPQEASDRLETLFMVLFMETNQSGGTRRSSLALEGSFTMFNKTSR